MTSIRALMTLTSITLLTHVACVSEVKQTDDDGGAGSGASVGGHGAGGSKPTPVSCDLATDGAACAEVGETCNFSDGQIGCVHTCLADGTWQIDCEPLPCPQDPSCGLEPPASGTSCNPYCDQQCSYEDVDSGGACGVTDVIATCSGAGEWMIDRICPADPPQDCTCTM